MFIDIHAHVEICKPVEQAIKKSVSMGVTVMLSCGINVKTNRETFALAQQYPEIKACLGLYPLDGLKMGEQALEEEIQFIRENQKEIIAIGECGLDLHECEDIEAQKKLLRRFVDLARELDKPIVIHSRKAEREAIEFLEEIGYQKILMHCFSGGKKLVRRIVENGWYLSVPSSCKYNEQFQQLIELVPLKQLFGETDSPFLHPDRKQNNIPGNVIESYKKIAEIKELPLKEVEEQIQKGYGKLFLNE